MTQCLMKMEIEFMQKQDKNTKKYIAKQLKQYMQKRYLDILHYLFSDAIDAEKNVTTLIKHEPHFFREIQQILEAQNYQNKENEFRENVDMTIPDVERYLEDARYQIILVNEAIERTMQIQALTPKSIKYKNGRIQHLQDRLNNLKITEERLTGLLSELQKEKRPVGRPPKNKTKELMEYIDDEDYEE